jgi:hypothetical protein
MFDRALNYPYAAIEEDFLFTDGAAIELEDDSFLNNRQAVLAVGSNRSPEQLVRKFGKNETIPVTKATLRDYDVFYSAHIASYGSIPAVLGRSDGTLVDLSVTWLLPHQLERMHETEARGKSYDYGESSSLQLDLGNDRSAKSIGCYLGRNGCASFDGGPIVLKEVMASDRKFPSADQKTILTHLYFSSCRNKSFEKWLETIIKDDDFRARVSEELAGSAIKNDLSDFEVR